MTERLNIPEINGRLRAFRLEVPKEIDACPGIRIFKIGINGPKIGGF